MNTPRTVQTAFRFKPDMLLKMKNRARYANLTLNKYVEHLIEADLKFDAADAALTESLRDIRIPEGVSMEVESLSCLIPPFTTAEIMADERLEYILSR